MYHKARFVTIFAKPAGRPLVDDYVVDIPQDTWIEQPWDMGITFIPPLVKVDGKTAPEGAVFFIIFI